LSLECLKGLQEHSDHSIIKGLVCNDGCNLQ